MTRLFAIRLCYPLSPMAAPGLDQYLRSLSATLSAPTQQGPVPHPSGFGPLYLPQPGEPPAEILLSAAGLPPDLLDNLLSHRAEARFFERVYDFAERVRDRFPRLVREVAWALVRRAPEEASRIAAFLLERNRLERPGNIALLCDLAEEDPQALVPHLDSLLARLCEGDPTDPAEGEHHLSDVFCLTDVPPAWLAAEVATRWQEAPDLRAREILLRLLVFHRALPLRSDRGRLQERVHLEGTNQQAYEYLLQTDAGTWPVLDLTRELQLNLSDLPKYAPSNHLRRFLGASLEVEGLLHAPDPGTERYLLQRIHQPQEEQAPQEPPRPPGRSRRRQRKAR